MFIVVGLGNPGKKYDGTRHNIGFEVIGELADRHHLPPSKSQASAEVSRGRIGRDDAMLVQPTTYMNLSGDAVGSIMRYFKAEPTDVIVIHDELDFEPGVVRVKRGGGHGGHNGLRSIISHIGREFVRVRVGVGKPPRGWDGADWVLGKIDAASRPNMDDAVTLACEAVETIVEQGVREAMNRFNQRPRDDAAE